MLPLASSRANRPKNSSWGPGRSFQSTMCIRTAARSSRSVQMPQACSYSTEPAALPPRSWLPIDQSSRPTIAWLARPRNTELRRRELSPIMARIRSANRIASLRCTSSGVHSRIGMAPIKSDHSRSPRTNCDTRQQARQQILRKPRNWYGSEPVRGRHSASCPFMADSVEKRFYGLERVTLIQNRSRVRNFDSNSAVVGFDCGVLAARLGLYQHYQGQADIDQWVRANIN